MRSHWKMQAGRRRAVMLVAMAAMLAACGAEDEGASGGDDCVSSEDAFFEEVWTPVLSNTCFACHNPQGQASDTDMVFWPSTRTGFEAHNFEEFRDIARVGIDGTPIVLLKPSMDGVAHEGGLQAAPGSDGYRALERGIAIMQNPTTCDDDGADDAALLDGVVLSDELVAFRRATLLIAGRLPTPDEEAAITAAPADGLQSSLDGLLREDAFYTWLIEVYNDQFLTDRYLRNRDALNLLNGDDFPDRFWYQALEESDPERYELGNRYTNASVAREPLELIAHVVRNDRPFTEILTADYRLVNPYSARAYGIDVDFDDEWDPLEWREGRIDGQPMAGVLTSPMWLNRFPTTDTNRNRHRSRMVILHFLATDVMKLAERPVDPTSIEDFNPTMFNPDCAVCHATIDPIAGAFQNWSASGRFLPPEGGWFQDMRRPGFDEEVTIPHADRLESLPWLADQIAADSRFALATVHTMYRALTGEIALTAPTDTVAANYADRLRAYQLQSDFFDQIASDFIAGGYDLRLVIEELVASPYFRATALSTAGAENAGILADVGVARLLTPEQLARKISAITGYPWARSWDSVEYLLSTSDYRIFYGGIDSNEITQRITSPNGIMANVGWRMAAEMSCAAVARDFVQPPEDRRLFPMVEPGFTPDDPNGFPIPSAVEDIRWNIQYLYDHVLGESLDIDDPEIDRAYQLFYDTWREGYDALADETEGYDRNLPWQCRARTDDAGEELPEDQRVESDELYTIRAWMAVVTYMLADYRFLYQ